MARDLPDSKDAARILRKEPRQLRSRQMVEDILQAAAECFASLGYAGTTTNKIAERAGVSVGSLYQYFPDKDSLLVHLQRMHHAEVLTIVREALDRLADPSVPLEDGLRRLLSDLVALHLADPALTRALSAAVRRESPSVDALHKHDDERDSAQRLGALLKTRPDIRDGDHLAMAAVLGQTVGQLSRWLGHDAPPDIDRHALLEETVQLLVLYLRK